MSTLFNFLKRVSSRDLNPLSVLALGRRGPQLGRSYRQRIRDSRESKPFQIQFRGISDSTTAGRRNPNAAQETNTGTFDRHQKQAQKEVRRGKNGQAARINAGAHLLKRSKRLSLPSSTRRDDRESSQESSGIVRFAPQPCDVRRRDLNSRSISRVGRGAEGAGRRRSRGGWFFALGIQDWRDTEAVKRGRL